MKKKFKILATAVVFAAVSAMALFADAKNIVYNETFDFKQIESINISLIYENLQISQIYGDEIVVEIGSNNIKKIPEVTIEEDTLVIKTKEQKVRKGNKCNVYLYLPQDFDAKSISVANVDGNISADILQAQNSVFVANISGRNDIASCKTELFTVSNVSGNSTLQKITADYFDFSSVSGMIFAELEEAPLATSGITNISGKTQIYYPKDADISKLKTSSISGKIERIAY